jgi:hypothetical protein
LGLLGVTTISFSLFKYIQQNFALRVTITPSGDKLRVFSLKPLIGVQLAEYPIKGMRYKSPSCLCVGTSITAQEGNDFMKASFADGAVKFTLEKDGILKDSKPIFENAMNGKGIPAITAATRKEILDSLLEKTVEKKP